MLSLTLKSIRANKVRFLLTGVASLLGVMAAVAGWSWKHRLHVFDTMDFIAPLVPAGLGFGRLGNYIGGELWGKYTGGHWGVTDTRQPSHRESAVDQSPVSKLEPSSK